MVSDYGTRLQVAMQARSITAQQLATRMDVSYQAIRKVLLGKSTAFSASNNTYAARILRISSDWLATGEGAMENADSQAQAADEQWLLDAWRVAHEEVREVACFALSKPDAILLPEWANPAMRDSLNSMRYAALCWLREDQAHKKITA